MEYKLNADLIIPAQDIIEFKDEDGDRKDKLAKQAVLSKGTYGLELIALNLGTKYPLARFKGVTNFKDQKLVFQMRLEELHQAILVGAITNK